jgi:hypothetical protein
MTQRAEVEHYPTDYPILRALSGQRALRRAPRFLLPE